METGKAKQRAHEGSITLWRPDHKRGDGDPWQAEELACCANRAWVLSSGMTSIPLPWVIAGAVLLLLVVLALKLSGSGDRDDLMGPRKRRPKRISPGEAGRLLELVEAGDEATRPLVWQVRRNFS